MDITNRGHCDLSLATGERIPRGRTVSVPDENVARSLSSAVCAHWFETGQLSTDGDLPETASVEVVTDAVPREDLVMAAIEEVLAEEDPDLLTADGKPKTDAINAVLQAGSHELTNSAERDALWDRREV